MIESFMVVPLHFTVEFLGFLVAAAGALLALTRSDLVPGETLNRLTVALGFCVLAVAQVLHGGAFEISGVAFQLDGEQLLVALKSIAFVLVLVGVVAGLKPKAMVPVAFVVREPLLLVSAGVAMVLSVVAFAGSRHSGPRAYRRLALGAFFTGVAELLTSVTPDTDFGKLAVSEYAYAAHAAKLVGFIGLGAWLWTSVRSSIRVRFVASFAALLVAVVLALASALNGVLTNRVEAEELDRVQAQLASAEQDIEIDATQELADDLESLAGFESVQGPIQRGGNLRSLAQEIDALEIFEFDFVMLMDPRGRVLGFSGEGPIVMRNGRPSRTPTRLRLINQVNINGSEVIQQVKRPETPDSASPVRVGPNLVAIMAAREVPDADAPSRSAGIIATGTWLDALTVQGLSSSVAARATIVLDGRPTVSSFPGLRESIVPADVQTLLRASDGPVADEHSIGSAVYFSAFTELGPPERAVATLVLSSPAQRLTQTREDLTRILFLVAMGIGLVALVLAWYSGRRITRPIQLLTRSAERVREGDLATRAPVAGDDEVGRLGETFNEMTLALGRMTEDLRDAAREEGRLRARIETIIQSMADGLVAVDTDRRVLAFNKEAEILTGIPVERALGDQIDSVLAAVDANGERVTLPIYDLAEGFVDGIFLTRKGREPAPVAVVCAPLPGEEEVVGGVAVLRDMAREREVERMKTEFLSNISHELRTPLTPIKGYAELLGQKDVPSDNAMKFARGILDSTSRLERIIQLLVDFSAMEAGRLSPRSKRLDISPLIEQLAGDWQRKSPRHSVVAEVNPHLPEVVVDEKLFRRSLEEVLDNAVKFSPNGGTVKLVARGKPAGNGERFPTAVEVCISDEGIGIPPEDLPKVFSDFHQLDGSMTRTYGGLGLGLAFVQRIIEAHEGSVAVDSDLDRGTRFTITIPAARRSPEAAEARRNQG
jgi:signal transduction histidine kinase